MNIVYTPHSVLLAKAKKVKKITNETRTLIEGMKIALRESDIGVGLAAPQVGVSLQIFLVSPHLPDRENKEGEKITVFINPKILSKTPIKKIRKKQDKRKLEGCLSIPEVWGPVTRSSKIVIEYVDENGASHHEKFSGFLATIIQHEIDHLNGVLFTQRVLEQGGKLYRELVDEKRFEEIEI